MNFPEDSRAPRPGTTDVAIVGLACTYPGARNAPQFWQNIINRVDAVTEVSPDRWDPAIFYDPDPATEDRIYCKKGGWIDGTYSFNPLRYGIMPAALEGTEADHFLVLRTAYEALDDAGYLEREKMQGLSASVILGKGNYTGPGVTSLMYRSMVTEQVLAIVKGLHPDFTDEDLQRLRMAVRSTLPRLTPEGAAGLIPNICTGRVANRLDFMGPNYTVDAACASSLIATEIGIRDLSSGKEDLVLAGGVHIFAHIPFLQVFDTMRALSLGSKIRPYDENCDGTIPGEGVGILVLKRLADAKRDGDRIYAVIRGAGSSSDGRAKGIVAPRREGEELAVHRAYEMSGVDPSTVGLIEGHGTATGAGDATEVEAIHQVFGPREKSWPTCAVGSVKSMIGHAMPAAGAAGLIKAALALHHRVLPPTLHCENPRKPLNTAESRFYVNTETRPWIQSAGAEPRRAGVNAFGFGGVNGHIVLEEYRDGNEEQSPTLQREWDHELVVVTGGSREQLIRNAGQLRMYALQVEGVALRDVASTLNRRLGDEPQRLTVVASSLTDLAGKLDFAVRRLEDPGCTQIKDRQGIFYLSDSEVRNGRVAMLFPGEGSQYVNMLSELCVHFPEVRACFDLADAASAATDPDRRPPSAMIFPVPFFSEDEARAAEDALWTIDRATESVLTANAAIFRLFEHLGVRADMMAGHSAGEWIAMAASGVIDTDEFIGSMGRLAGMHHELASSTEIPRMSMLAVGTGREKAEKLAGEIQCEIHVANDNCAHQVVVVVQPADEPAVVAHFQKNGVFIEKLPYDRGYHTPAFTYICEPLRGYFSGMDMQPAGVPVYSCTTADVYPADRTELIELLSQTFARPLIFRQMIERMYADGARIFIEAGPRGNLTAFVDDVLRGRPHLCVSADQFKRPGLLTLQTALAMLAAAHVPLNLAPLYNRRDARTLTFDPAADHQPNEASLPGTMQVSICYPRLGVPEPLPRPAVQVSEREPVLTMAAAASGNSAVVFAPPPAASNVTSPVVEPYMLSGNGVAPEFGTALDDHVSLMEEFLRTHEAVMTGFFGAAPATVPVSSAAPAAVSWEPAPLQLTQAVPEAPPPALPLPIPAAEPPAVSLSATLLRIVSDRTGYPADMLGLDLDMEADLGIDSIKRVEILAALRQEAESAGMGGNADMEAVARLKTLREIIGFLDAGDTASAPAPAAAGIEVQLRESPMIRFSTVLAHEPGKSITLRCLLDPSEHLFLKDHCLYFEASDTGSQASPLLSMPMTGSLEMMAETAALLQPGMRVTGAKSVQASRWINVKKDGEPFPLTVTATVAAEGHVRVMIRPETATSAKMPELLAEAMIVLGPAYTPGSTLGWMPLRNPREPVFTARTVYSDHLMFHGPSFQGIIALDAVGEDGVLGALTVLPDQDMLRSSPSPRFHIDPFLLDAAGQLVGYWPVEYLSEGYVALPIRIGEIRLHGEPAPAGAQAECRVRVKDVTHRQMKADFEVVGKDSKPWMTVLGWEDWRFYWERHIHQFWRFPQKSPNGRALSFAMPRGVTDLVCQRIDPMGEMDKTGLWEVLWMHMILNERELAEYQTISEESLRAQWIFERATAKDALRAWVKQHHGKCIYPADVDLQFTEGRQIAASGHWTSLIPQLPFLSVAYSERIGIGVASREPIAVAAAQAMPDEDKARREAAEEAARKLLASCSMGVASAGDVRPVHVSVSRDGDLMVAIASFEKVQ